MANLGPVMYSLLNFRFLMIFRLVLLNSAVVGLCVGSVAQIDGRSALNGFNYC